MSMLPWSGAAQRHQACLSGHGIIGEELPAASGADFR
jgi:hypothetical protein